MPVAERSDLEFDCRLCSSRFQTKDGRSQHMRVKHPIEYNDNLETRSDKNKSWNNRELKDLALAQILVGLSSKINKELHALFPHRTVEAIATVRKKGDFRRLVDELQSEDSVSSPPAPEPVPDVGPRDDSVGDRISALQRMKYNT